MQKQYKSQQPNVTLSDNHCITFTVAVSLVRTTTQASTGSTTTPTKTSTAQEEETGNIEFLQITDTTVQVWLANVNCCITSCYV